MGQTQTNILPGTKLGNNKLREYLNQLMDSNRLPESMSIFLTALLVGIGVGLGAVVFRLLLSFFQDLFFNKLGGLLQGFQPWHLLIIPALGGLIYGPMIFKIAREAKGHGVPEVMEAIALKGGRIRPIVAVIKSLASAICIASGGSVGREGPMAQIGSAIGSTIGQYFNLSDERIKNLVACGAAGGIAATFNAPIAGAIFALEIILGQLHAVYFGAVVISSVTADMIAHMFFGEMRAFSVPDYTLLSYWELILYVVLGILMAFASVAFTRMLYVSEDLFDGMHFPEYLKPVLGGLLLGVIGIISPKIDGFPQAFGVGYESISLALFGKMALIMTFTLFALKFLATIITLGVGGSGGIFAPSMFMGAMLGEAYGQLVGTLFPSITAPPGAYALVGMAVFFAGAAHAPMTAIIILFELTGNYEIILPLMLATVTGTLLSRAISPESIYTLKLTRRGIHIQEGKDIDVMQTLTVGEAMAKDYDMVQDDLPLSDLASKFERSHHHGFPVVDKNNKLVGVVSIQDLDLALEAGVSENAPIREIATCENLIVAHDDEPMWTALRKLGVRDIGRVPVVKKGTRDELVGVIRRKDIIQAYNIAIVQRARHQSRAERQRLGKIIDSKFIEINLPSTSPVVGKRISEITLPKDCLIVSIQRGRKMFIAHGNSTLHEDDQLTIITREDLADRVREILVTEG